MSCITICITLSGNTEKEEGQLPKLGKGTNRIQRCITEYVSRRITSYHAVSRCIMSSVSQSRITLYHDVSHRITNPVSRRRDTGLAVIRGGPRITEATCDTEHHP